MVCWPSSACASARRAVAARDGELRQDDVPASRQPAGPPTQTGSGNAKWTVEKDATAPSKPNVLKQSGQATYPVCIKDDTSVKDGFVEVKFKPISGREDQAGGVVWRGKDANNYYVARANALEDNVTIYHTVNGRRTEKKRASMKVAPNQWHTLARRLSGQSLHRDCSTARRRWTGTTTRSRMPARSASGPRPTASRCSTISPTAPNRDFDCYTRQISVITRTTPGSTAAPCRHGRRRWHRPRPRAVTAASGCRDSAAERLRTHRSPGVRREEAAALRRGTWQRHPRGARYCQGRASALSVRIP